MNLIKLDDECTGTCPMCSEHDAFSYGVTGKDGYVDICDECVDAMAANGTTDDFIEEEFP